MVVSLPVGAGYLNLSPLKEQPELLMAESSLQPSEAFFFLNNKVMDCLFSQFFLIQSSLCPLGIVI